MEKYYPASKKSCGAGIFGGARAGGYARVGAGFRRRGAYAGARAGAMMRNTAGWGRSRIPGVIPGYTRRVGMYGRFGTGRGPRAQIELKKHDLALTFAAGGATASTSPATGNLNCNINQGLAGSGNRIGNKIIIKSIQLKLDFTLGFGPAPADIYHLYLIQDSQCNGTLPVAADVFIAAGPMGTQLRTIENGARFRILKHFVVKLDSTAPGVGGGDGDYIQEECYIKCNIPIVYSSTTGVIAEVRSNNLFMVYGSSGGTATATGNARIRFTDL